MNKTTIKKSRKGSFFRSVKIPSTQYSWRSLKIDDGYEVLQIMPLNDDFVVVEYGKYEELEEEK